MMSYLRLAVSEQDFFHSLLLNLDKGDLQFKFYHRWFDVIFLISALSSIFFLYLAHKQAPEKTIDKSQGQYQLSSAFLD